MSVSAAMVVHADEPFEVRSQDFTDEPTGTRFRILSVRIGEWRGDLAIQCDPEPMLALFDRVRSALIAEVGRAWPVETAHEVVPA